jgi:hypothetical protein
MNLFRLSAGVAVLVALAGCATSAPYSGGRTWDAGWRKGLVTSVHDELRWYQRAACGRTAAPTDKFVSVSYRVSGQTRWKFIPMPLKDAPALQTKVLINVNSCELVADA